MNQRLQCQMYHRTPSILIALGVSMMYRCQVTSPGVYGSIIPCRDTHEAVCKPWLSLEVAIPENKATHCRLSYKCKIKK